MIQSSSLSKPGKVPILVILLLIIAFVLGALGWYLLSQPSEQPTSTANTNDAVGTRPAEPESTTPPIEGVVEQGEDTDRDGLSDEEEKTAGTDPAAADSDDDGLSDRAELKVYQTNPQDADSDDDGRRDGEEVKAGQNPKGSGVLLDLPSALEKLKEEP